MGIKEPALARFYRWARHHGWTQARLADVAGCGRVHLCLVLTGERRGVRTWIKIVDTLPEDGIQLLKQCSAWNAHAEAACFDRARRERAEQRALAV
jgi:hypothetical protein